MIGMPQIALATKRFPSAAILVGGLLGLAGVFALSRYVGNVLGVMPPSSSP